MSCIICCRTKLIWRGFCDTVCFFFFLLFLKEATGLHLAGVCGGNLKNSKTREMVIRTMYNGWPCSSWVLLKWISYCWKFVKNMCAPSGLLVWELRVPELGQSIAVLVLMTLLAWAVQGRAGERLSDLHECILTHCCEWNESHWLQPGDRILPHCYKVTYCFACV